MGLDHEQALHGWKNIAAYLNRDIRTVQRWEIQRGLPVKRIPGEGRGSVYAVVTEIDEWLAGNEAASGFTDQDPTTKSDAFETPVLSAMLPSSPPATPCGSRPVWIAAGALTLMVTVLYALQVHRHPLSSPQLARDPPATQRIRPIAPSDEQYLQSMYLYERRTPSSLRAAERLMVDLTGRQPENAAAWSALAQIRMLLRLYDVDQSPEMIKSARFAAEHALGLNPSLAEPHAVLGFIDFFLENDGVGLAEEEFRRAIQLNPACATAHSWYGLLLTYEAKYGEARAHLDLAQSLEPSSTAIMANRALAIGLSGQRPEALNLLRQAGGEDPLPAIRYDLSVLATVSPRNLSVWLNERIRLSELSNDTVETGIYFEARRAFEQRGETAMWRSIETACQKAHVKMPLLAEAQAALGEKDAAFGTLVELQQHEVLRTLAMDPVLLPLHRDSRFGQLLIASGLPVS